MLGAAGCAAPSFGAEGKTRLRYWHLFGGGDGANMTALVDAFAQEHPGIDLEATQLQWGTPYYTKLGMAGVGGRAPEVAVLHLARLSGSGPGRLLDPFDLDLLRDLGVGTGQFPEAIFRGGTIDGQQYAIPLDTHPMVLYYNTDVCAKAGLPGQRPDVLRPALRADDGVGRHRGPAAPGRLRAVPAADRAGGGAYGTGGAVRGRRGLCDR